MWALATEGEHAGSLRDISICPTECYVVGDP